MRWSPFDDCRSSEILECCFNLVPKFLCCCCCFIVVVLLFCCFVVLFFLLLFFSCPSSSIPALTYLPDLPTLILKCDITSSKVYNAAHNSLQMSSLLNIKFCCCFHLNLPLLKFLVQNSKRR